MYEGTYYNIIRLKNYKENNENNFFKYIYKEFMLTFSSTFTVSSEGLTFVDIIALTVLRRTLASLTA